jgi:hypothetical protein
MEGEAMSKKNFRCTDDAAWEAGLGKGEVMRRAGYDIDMTSVLNRAVLQFVEETIEETVARFELTQGEQPVNVHSSAAFRRWAAAGDR